MTTLTDHASLRITERLSMTHKEVVELLNRGLFVTVAIEPGTNRYHRLFFSKEDRMCFVAVQDVKTNELVTILPVNGNAEISGESCEKATEIYCESEQKTYFCPKVFQDDQKIRFTFFFGNTETGKLRPVQLRLSANKYIGYLETIEDNISLSDVLNDFIKSQICQGEVIASIIFKTANKMAGLSYPHQKFFKMRSGYGSYNNKI